jgi:hypothetical protein
MAEQEKIPEFNNLAEQKIYALGKCDELLMEIEKAKQAFDTPEEVARLTEIFNNAKATIASVSLEEYVSTGAQEKDYVFLADVAAFATLEDYIAGLKERAETTKQTFIMFRKTLEDTRV